VAVQAYAINAELRISVSACDIDILITYFGQKEELDYDAYELRCGSSSITLQTCAATCWFILILAVHI